MFRINRSFDTLSGSFLLVPTNELLLVEDFHGDPPPPKPQEMGPKPTAQLSIPICCRLTFVFFFFDGHFFITDTRAKGKTSSANTLLHWTVFFVELPELS
jgi:hypothetical protein